MVGVQSVVDGLVQTFGPFLIPVTVFAVGVAGYTVLFLVSRQFRDDETEDVVSLSAETPERSATDGDRGAGTRSVLTDGAEGVTEEGDETAGGDAEGDRADGAERGSEAADADDPAAE